MSLRTRADQKAVWFVHPCSRPRRHVCRCKVKLSTAILDPSIGDVPKMSQIIDMSVVRCVIIESPFSAKQMCILFYLYGSEVFWSMQGEWTQCF